MKLEVMPCIRVDGREVEQYTLKAWFAKLDEELNEFKVAQYAYCADEYLQQAGDKRLAKKAAQDSVIEEGADLITVIISFLAAMGATPRRINQICKAVIDKNRSRGRL